MFSMFDRNHLSFLQISSSFVGQLKSIRQLCLARIVDFFEILQDFDYSPYIEKIFKCAVIPQVFFHTNLISFVVIITVSSERLLK